MRPALRQVLLSRGFSLSAFLAGLSGAAYWDFSRTDGMFQESVGPTPADAITEPVGLIFDRATWGGKSLPDVLAGQPELRGGGAIGSVGTATPATYNTATGAGVVSRAASVNDQSFVQFSTLVVGKTYFIDIQNTGIETMQVRLGSHTAGALVTLTTGQRSALYFTAPSSVTVTTGGVNGITSQFTLHSVKEVPGNHALQATSAARPLLGPIPKTLGEELRGGGVVGLLGTATAATYNTSTGAAVVHRAADAYNQSYVIVSGLYAEKLYSVDLECAGSVAAQVQLNGPIGASLVLVAPGERKTLNYRGATALAFTTGIVNGATAQLIIHSVKEVLTYDLAAKYDGVDDNLLTPYYAGAGENFIVARVVVPASIASGQIITGATEASSANRFFLSIGVDGVVQGGVGGHNGNTIKGTTDVRGQTVVICLTFNGSTVKLYVNGVEQYSGAQSGAPTQVFPIILGGNNVAGSAANRFSGSTGQVVTGRKFLTLAEFNQIATVLERSGS